MLWLYSQSEPTCMIFLYNNIAFLNSVVTNIFNFVIIYFSTAGSGHFWMVNIYGYGWLTHILQKVIVHFNFIHLIKLAFQIKRYTFDSKCISLKGPFCDIQLAPFR